MIRGRATATGRHRSRARPLAAVVSGTAVLGAVAAFTLIRMQDSSVAADHAAARATSTPPVSTSRTATTATAGSAAPAPTTTKAAPAAPAPAPSPAVEALTRLVATRSDSSTSVAALDTTTGARTTVGAGSGMTTASAVKVQLLETLMLERQNSGDDLTDTELTEATAMIEHSDNAAAEAVFYADGGRAKIKSYEDDLGLSTTLTVPGDGDYWGLTTTSAAQQLVLLQNLVGPDGPLDASSRALALRLMRNVEADQMWGVPAAATSGDPAVKNGWLNITDDDDLWAVNSLGVVTVHGHTVLIAVMTQHNASYDSGKQRVARLVTAAAAAVKSATP